MATMTTVEAECAAGHLVCLAGTFDLQLLLLELNAHRLQDKRRRDAGMRIRCVSVTLQ